MSEIPSSSKSAGPGRRSGMVERLALLAVMALSPSEKASPESQTKGVVSTEGGSRLQDHEADRRVEVIRQRLAQDRSGDSVERAERPSGEVLPSQEGEGEVAEHTSESIERDARLVAEQAMSLFDEGHTAADNFDDIGTYIRTQAQDRLQGGHTSFQVSEFVKAATAAAYADLDQRLTQLRQQERSDYADELELWFSTWNPALRAPAETQTVVENGVTIETTSTAHMIRLPTNEDHADGDDAEGDDADDTEDADTGPDITTVRP